MRIGANTESQPHFEVLDAEGKIVHRVPMQSQSSK
jgi:hypothetical protein